MEIWQWVLLALAAIVTGAIVIAVLELRSTLRETRAFLKTTGARLDSTLSRAEEALGHVNNAARSVDQGAGRVRDLAAGLSEFGAAFSQAGKTVRTVAIAAAALVPAAMAAWKTFFSREEYRPTDHPERQDLD